MSINKKTSNSTFFALLILVNQHFWKSMSGPFLAFIFPLILVCTLGFSLGYNSAFPGAFVMGIIAIGLNILPATIADFRKSSLLKRIFSTPIKPMKILLILCFFFFVLMIISFCTTFSLSILFFVKYYNIGQVINLPGFDNVSLPSFSQVLSHIDWVGFLYSTFLVIILSIILGLTIASVFKEPSTINSISLMLLVVTILLSGLAIPNVVVRNNNILWFFSYVATPFKPVVSISIESYNGAFFEDNSFMDTLRQINPSWEQMFNLNGSSWYNINSTYSIFNSIVLPGLNTGEAKLFDKVDKILNNVLPYVWISVFLPIIFFKFKWNNR